MGCWTCLPFCENCKPKFYDCPECGGKGSIYFRKCTECNRPMEPEDADRARALWHEARRGHEENSSNDQSN